MQQTCRNTWCKQPFAVNDDELSFLEKVSPIFRRKKFLIPSSAYCPECRQQRRLQFRNERTLYKRTCDKTGKQILSVYSEENPCTVYDQDAWWSDTWDALEYGVEADNSSAVFPQIQSLMRNVPRRNLAYVQNENSDFTNVCSNNKNCYMLFSSDFCEDCYFVSGLQKSTGCIDCSTGSDNAWCYECLNCTGCHSCTHCISTRNSNDCSFCFDCSGCSSCLFCAGIRNKKYYIANQERTPKEFFEALNALRSGSASALERGREHFEAWMANRPRNALHQTQCEDCTGDYIMRSKNCRDSFNVSDSIDCASLFDGVSCRDCRDCYEMGHSELCYQVTECFPGGYHDLFCVLTAHTSDMLYCDHCYNSKHLFGCVGLHHKEYCIFNKQYSKEEYEKLVPVLIEQMIENGEWGEFFPSSLSPFGYNESDAARYFPLTKAQAKERNLPWNDYEPPFPSTERTIQAKELPDALEDIPDDVLNWAIKCGSTAKPFKLIKQELEFYRNMHLPVPRLHPEERHQRRLALRNPRKLWQDKCSKCHILITTSYKPNKYLKVYCNECYIEEVI